MGMGLQACRLAAGCEQKEKRVRRLQTNPRATGGFGLGLKEHGCDRPWRIGSRWRGCLDTYCRYSTVGTAASMSCAGTHHQGGAFAPNHYWLSVASEVSSAPLPTWPSPALQTLSGTSWRAWSSWQLQIPQQLGKSFFL